MARNVLLLVMDTARADAFEPYGAKPGSTPTVAQLASSGTAVHDMFATASWTLPSHASMFTGEMPRALGLGQAPGGSPAGARPVLEAQEHRMLPAVLRRAGWETKAVSTNLWVSPHAGFDTGFDAFELVHAGARQERVERTNVRGRLVWAYEGLRARADDGAAQAEEVLSRWVRDIRADRPFFWFVNLVECHSPYLPPKPYNDLGPVERLKAADEARRHLSLEAIWRSCLMDLNVPEAALERMQHLYARSVRLMDDWLARILERLEAAGALQDTTVIVTSDHGENFGEGGLLAHAFSLDDRLIRVPFVSNCAEVAVGGEAASLASLPELLADHLGVAQHPWSDPDIPRGVGVAQFDFVDADDPRVQIATDAWGLDAAAQHAVSTPLTCVTDGSLKLMSRGGREELYDLTEDGEEVKPLSPDEHSEADRVRRLREAMATPALSRSPASTAPVSTPTTDVEDLERRMKLLGYM
jgi:arylsulfatase A-like enzyme